MDMLFIVLVIFIFLILFFPKGEEQKTHCKGPHKWVYKKQPDNEQIEYLQCENCGRFPGAEMSDES